MSRLRGLLAEGKTIVAPGATDALSAKLIEAHGFIGAAVAARKNPELMIVARSDAFWVAHDLEDCIARLALYAEAGAGMVFPTAVVLYYAFSTLVQFEALSVALRDFRSDKRPGGQESLENFLGYG
jgi:2-methylisocitrate lyase-like PEP mutase family enzyme